MTVPVNGWVVAVVEDMQVAILFVVARFNRGGAQPNPTQQSFQRPRNLFSVLSKPFNKSIHH